MTPEEFVKSRHCRSRAHCTACLTRTPAAGIAWPDDCPYGVTTATLPSAATNPNSLAEPGVFSLIQAVLDPWCPCITPWCAELRAAYQAELDALGEGCNGCQSAGVRKKFAKLIEARLKEDHE